MKPRQKTGQTGEKQSIELQLKREKGAPLWVRVDIEADRDKTEAVTQWRAVIDGHNQTQTDRGGAAQKREENAVGHPSRQGRHVGARFRRKPEPMERDGFGHIRTSPRRQL